MKMLIADDDPITRHLLAGTLTRWGYDVVSCSDGQQALNVLLEDQIKLAILDWEMPEMNGIEICRHIRTLAGSQPYIVLLSARNTQLDVIAGLEAGADDFVRKPFDAGELRARLKTGMRIIELEKSLQEQALRDPLTGLYNRRYMQETLERELNRAVRKNTEVGIILADIDHFKKINDTFGHQAGDVVLREISGFLRDHIRSSDVVCRFGGEEFLLVLPDSSADGAFARAEDLRSSLAECEIEYQGRSIDVTFSAGVAVFPHSGATVDELIAAADRALYHAKSEGRNRVVLYSGIFEMQQAV